MKKALTQIQRLRRLVWTGGFVALVTIIVAITGSWLLYQQTVTLLTQNLRERLLTISITEATNINAADVEALHTESDWQKPEWARVVNSLHAAKYANDSVVYMYMFRKTASDPNQMEYIADADSINPFANTDADPANDVDVNRDGKIEPDGADKLQWPGQPYPEAVDIPEAFQAYNGPLTVKDLYTDDYGTVLTGYAPIKDAAGNTIAVLATDIKANDFFTVTRQTLYPFIIFISFLILIISILAIVLIYLWERQAEGLAKLDRLKNEFLSVASHQLRAPLTAIKGYVANISENAYGEVPSYLYEPLAVVQESARIMATSIEDYLNVSRIEQGRMKYDISTFNVTTLARRAAEEMKPVANNKKIELTFIESSDVFVKADFGKIKQVFSNLIDNAIKYTENGDVTVSVGVSGKMVRFMTEDTGIGISAEEIGKLFEKFTRARDANKVNTTGTGLGLYVAKNLVEGQGGKIWVESDGIGKGSRFIVELPLVSEPTAPTPATT